MMQFLKQNKLLTLGGAVALVAAFGYFTFFSDGSPQELVSSSDDALSSVSRDLIVTLSNLHTLRLDETLFDDPVFLSLSDFGVTIPPENVGRLNPFAPLGGN